MVAPGVEAASRGARAPEGAAAPVAAKRPPAVVFALADRLFPRGGAFEPGAVDARVAEGVMAYAATLPRLDRLALRLLFFAVEWLPIAFRFSRFSRLAAERQDALLRALADSRVYLARMVFLLLKAVFALSFYRDPAVRRALGYYLPCPPGGERAPTTTPDGVRSVL